MLSTVKTVERELARTLRKDGRAITEIAAELGVAKSSVSRWVRDVPLTPEQRDTLLRRSVRYEGQWKGSAAVARLARARREAYHQEGRVRARRGDSGYAAGCMLYWAEGEKARNVVGFVNSDPEMMRAFLDFLRAYFDVPDHRVRVTCNLFADHQSRVAEIEDFWLATLRLPRQCLRKSKINVYSKYSQKKRRNRLPYGTCKLVVANTQIVQTIYGSIQEYGGFTREQWLD
jgi:hypothetical protein